jgi:hypothetical protein
VLEIVESHKVYPRYLNGELVDPEARDITLNAVLRLAKEGT